MKGLLTFVVVVVSCSTPHGQPTADWTSWPNSPPADIPFNASAFFSNFEFQQCHEGGYGGADTWYPSWSTSGEMFTSWTDGTVSGVTSNSCGPCGGNASSVTQGHARIVGDDPDQLQVMDVATYTCSALPYEGRYPSANFFYQGVWYYGTYTLSVLSGNSQYPCGNWCVQGPFVGFRYSVDFGKTWVEPRLVINNNTDNLFGEVGPQRDPSGVWHGKVKFGAPHIVDLGQELQYSADGYMYLIGHGADAEHQPQSWMQGSQVYMARVKPSPHTMITREAWQFFAGYYPGTNSAVWAGTVQEAKPLFTWENRTGVVTMTFLPDVKRYTMCISTPHNSPRTDGPFDTYFLESESITGPFRYITYLQQFGPEAYFVHIPSKFWGYDEQEPQNQSKYTGGRLSYSANFAGQVTPANPVGSGYHWTLLPFRFTINQ